MPWDDNGKPRRARQHAFRLDLFATFLVWAWTVLLVLYANRFAAARYWSLWPFTLTTAACCVTIQCMGAHLAWLLSFQAAPAPVLARRCAIYCFTLTGTVTLNYATLNPGQQQLGALYGLLIVAVLLFWAPTLPRAHKVTLVPLHFLLVSLACTIAFATLDANPGAPIPPQVLLYRLLPHIPALGLDKTAMAADLNAIGALYPPRVQLPVPQYLAVVSVHALVHGALLLNLRAAPVPDQLSGPVFGYAAQRFGAALYSADRLRVYVEARPWARRTLWAAGQAAVCACALLATTAAMTTSFPAAYVPYHGGLLSLAMLWVCMIKTSHVQRLVTTITNLRLLQGRRESPSDDAGDLTLGPEVGSGASGSVYQATWNGITVAAKVMTIGGDDVSSAELHRLTAEAYICKTLRHPFIVTTYAALVLPDEHQHPTGSSHRIVICTDFCPAGSLNQHMHRLHGPSGPRWPAILETLSEIASALEYLHCNHVVHGDLKPENVLVKESGASAREWVTQLCDFGMARVLDTTDDVLVTRSSVGTIAYTAPEIITNNMLSLAADVWAFGVLAWQLSTGRPPFQGIGVMQRLTLDLHAIAQHLPPPEGLPAPLALILDCCWVYDHRERAPISEIKRILQAGTGERAVSP